MMKKRKVDARFVKKATLTSTKSRAGSNRCTECGVCAHCADWFYEQYGNIIRTVAAQVRMRHLGETLDTAVWTSLMDKGLPTPRMRTLVRPYADDLAIILAAAKIHNHPVMFFEYAMAVIEDPGFDITRDLDKLLPWNLMDYYLDFAKGQGGDGRF
jgi:hypothetical protein